MSQAAVVFSFAVEEFGKAMLLRNAYDTGTDPVTVSGFYEHSDKLAAAANVIPRKYLCLTRPETRQVGNSKHGESNLPRPWSRDPVPPHPRPHSAAASEEN